jgi:hypothetical protein
MSDIVVGSSVIYDHAVSGTGSGVWSGFVTNTFRQSNENWASVTFDGVIVPPMMRCGIQGPQPWTNTLNINVTALTLRSVEPGDDEKRQLWLKKVREYQNFQNAVDDAQHAADVQRFSHVVPGMAVTWVMNAGQFDNGGEFPRGARVNRPFKGTIDRVRKNGLEAYVTGFDLTSTNPDKPHTFRLMLERLVFV